MKKKTKKIAGLGVILASVLGGIVLWRSSKTAGLGQLSPNEQRHSRYVRQMAKRQGLDLSPKPVVYEKVLPNGMTRKFAEKYVKWLKSRGTKITHKHISPSSLALPVDEAVR